jgi:hypothetical protein
VAALLTWGVIVRRREQVQRRPELGVFAAVGWVLAIAYIVLERRVDGEDAALAVLRAASFTTGCVFFEIIISPRRELVPQAILVRDKEARGGTREDTDGNANQRA